MINLHPPVYLWICSLFNKAYGGRAASFEAVSIFFSLGTLLLTWRLARFLFGRWVGVLAMFFLAVTPAASVFDTWIKQDATAIFFLVLTIYLFVRKRYIWSGIALGIGMLSKETAVFALLALGTYTLASWRRDLAWGLAKVGALGAVISFWWYLWVSDYVGHFGDFFLGRGLESKLWGQPWYYYFAGLPEDLGWVILTAAIAGLLICLWRYAKGSRIYSLPVAWFLSIYAFLSCSAGKPYWMVAPALPAAAILAAVGTREAAAWAGKRIPVERYARVAQGAIVSVVLAGAFLGTAFTGYADFNRNRQAVYWNQAEYSRQDAEFLQDNLEEGDKLYTIFNSADVWDPTLLYYFGDVDIIPAPPGLLTDPAYVAGYLKSLGKVWIYIGVDPAYDADLRVFLEEIGGLLEVKGFYPSDWSIIIEVGQ